MLTKFWSTTVLMVAVVLFPDFAACAPRVVGQHFKWRASFRAELQGSVGTQQGLVSLSGEWSSTVVAIRPDGYDVRYQFDVLQLDGNGKSRVNSKELGLAKVRLGKPFWVSCGRDGSLRTIYFLKEVSASDRNLLQTIATETQFVQAETNHGVWTSMERDGGGGYVAIYQRQDASHVRKKKLKYLDEDSANGPSQPLQLTIEESEVEFTFSLDGGVTSVDGVQRVRMGLSGVKGDSLVARVEVHLSDVQSSLEPNSGMNLGIPTGVDDLPITTHQTDSKVAQAEMDAQLLTGQSNEEILSAAVKGDPAAERTLVAMFRRRPESIALGVKHLNGTSGVQVIASGMAEAGTDASFHALGEVAHDTSRSIGVRMNTLMAIEGIREPSVEAMRIPLSLLDDHDPQIRDAARLASGALARAGRKSHAAEAEEIEAELVARFNRSKTAEEKKEFMAALGNSAGPGTLATLTPLLKDEREDIRSSAVRGLRLVPGDATDILLAKVAKEDKSATVRGATLYAIGFRLPLTRMLWDAILNSARNDSSESVRNRAISLLSNDASRPPETENTLEWIAEHDAVEAVRRIARQSLAEIRNLPPR